MPLQWIPRSKSGTSKSRPRWAAHTRIGNVWECPPGVVSNDQNDPKAFQKTGSNVSEHQDLFVA